MPLTHDEELCAAPITGNSNVEREITPTVTARTKEDPPRVGFDIPPALLMHALIIHLCAEEITVLTESPAHLAFTSSPDWFYGDLSF